MENYHLAGLGRLEDVHLTEEPAAEDTSATCSPRSTGAGTLRVCRLSGAVRSWVVRLSVISRGSSLFDMAPGRCHLPLLPLLVLLAVRPTFASPVPAADTARHDTVPATDTARHYDTVPAADTARHNDTIPATDTARHYDLQYDLHSDIDRQSIYDAFESYISYPPYSSASNSYSSSNSYGPASDYSSWGGSGSWGDSGGGYTRGSSRHVLRLEPRCDCAPVDLLALLSGGTALCALGLFCMLQATSGVSISAGSNVSVEARQLLADRRLLDSWRVIADSWQPPADSGQLPGQLDWLLQQLPRRLQPVIQKLSIQLRRLLQQLPEQQLTDRITDVTCEISHQLETGRLGRSVRSKGYLIVHSIVIAVLMSVC